MPADAADTELSTGENQLDGKPLPPGRNIFDPAELEKQGLTLDPPELEEDEDEDDFIDLDEDTEEEPDTEEEEPLDDDALEAQRLLERYKTPEAVAKALKHAQRKLSEQGNELGQLRGRENALLELVKRAGVSGEEKQEDVDDGVPKDEFGIPKPPDDYWRKVYYPQLKSYFTNKFMEEGYEETEAAVLATDQALEMMTEERDKWKADYQSKRAEAQARQASLDEEAVQENSKKQTEAIATEKEKITDLCARMGVDPEEGFKKVMEVAGAMVDRAFQLKQLTLVQASRPETAVQAIWGAWAYLQSSGDLPYAQNEKQPAHPPAPTGRTGGAAPRPRPTAQAQTTTASYSDAHKKFASSLGMTPDELEKKYGRL